MAKQLVKRDNSHYRSDLGPIEDRDYEINHLPRANKDYLSVPREDLIHLGLTPEWNQSAFLSPETRRSFMGEYVFLTEEDTSVFTELYTRSVGKAPRVHRKETRSQLSRLPRFSDPVRRPEDPELPTAVVYTSDPSQTTDCSAVTVYNPILQSVTDFVMYCMVHDLVDNHTVQGPRMLETSLRMLKVWIRSKTPKLSGTFYDDKTRLMWVYTLRTDFPCCPICGRQFGHLKNVHLSKVYDAYQPHCSSRCARLDPQALKKYKEASLRIYGVSHPHKSKIVKERIKKTNLKKYGVEFYTQTSGFVDRALKAKNHNRKLKNRPQADGIVFDSGWELEFYTLCRNRRIEVEYHPCKFEYEYLGKKWHYYPDFRIGDKIYEIKGDNFINPDGSWKCPFRKKGMSDERYAIICGQVEAKHQCALRHGVIILARHEMDNLEKIIGV